MLSETEEFLQNIPVTNHAQYCQYPCYCAIGSAAALAYLENIRRIMTTVQSVTVIEPRPRMRSVPKCG